MKAAALASNPVYTHWGLTCAGWVALVGWAERELTREGCSIILSITSVEEPVAERVSPLVAFFRFGYQEPQTAPGRPSEVPGSAKMSCLIGVLWIFL